MTVMDALTQAIHQPDYQGGSIVNLTASIISAGRGEVGYLTQVFNDMVMDAKHLCQELNGTLVDHNLRGMTQKALKRISGQIRQIVYEMEQEGVTPGGDKSLRLF